MTLGSAGWGAVGDTYGRRNAFLGASVLTVAFGLASAGAPNFSALLAFRTMVGLGVSGDTYGQERSIQGQCLQHSAVLHSPSYGLPTNHLLCSPACLLVGLPTARASMSCRHDCSDQHTA
jgi:MFS family permease